MEAHQPFLNGVVEYIDGVECSNQISIASGGMASIFRGEYTRIENGVVKKTPVAIKMLHGMHTDQNMLARFQKRLEREGKNLRAAVHPNIVSFFGYCRSGVIEAFPSPGLVTLFCENGTIMEYLGAKKADHSISGTQNRVKLIIDIAKGLAHLHSLSFIEDGRNVVMVHGDVKPKNVLILDNGSAAICDFGQSRIIEERGYTTKLMTSAKYVAQEILADDMDSEISGTSKMTSTKGDVYSYAMTALEVVSGVEPFASRREMRIIMSVCKGGRPKKAEHKDVPEPLWDLLVRAWGVDPAGRPTMEEVVNELITTPMF